METKTDNCNAIPGINYRVYKEMVDFVYELTKDKEYTDGFAVYKNKILSLVVSEMVRRGVLQKKQLAHYPNGKKGRYFAFTWAARMAPTQNFVRSVANAIIERERVYKDKYQKRVRAEKKQQKLAEAQAPDIPILDVEIPDVNEVQEEVQQPIMQTSFVVTNPVSENSISLKDATPQQLWDELKSRGAKVVDGKIIIELD